MQFRRSVGMGVLVGLLLLTGVILGVLVWHSPESLGLAAGSDRQMIWLWVISATTLVVVVILGGYHLLGRQLGHSAYHRLDADDVVPPAQPAATASFDTRAQPNDAVKTYLRERHGPFWRQKVRLLLVVGEPVQIEAIAPGLAEQQWQEGRGTVLVWGGSVQTKPDESLLAQWRGLSRWRALDGVVWALDKAQSADAALMRTGVRCLRDLARELHWQLPLYLWQVCDRAWPQPTRTIRTTQPVGCRLPARCTAVQLETHLGQLLEPLRQQGLAQMQGDMSHDFLLRLSRDLQAEGIVRWRQALAPLLGEFARGVPLRGLWFSLPLTRAQALPKHDWLADPVWGGVLEDKASNARRLGWNAPRIGYALVLGLALVWGAGLLLSFATNRALIAQVQTALTAVQQPGSGDQQLLALNELVRELGRLVYRAEHGAPWYQRFGLNQNPILLVTRPRPTCTSSSAP